MPDLHEFAGSWRIERWIDDRASGCTGRFEGTASFEPTGDELRYLEQGTLLFGGCTPLRAERRYVWRTGASGVIEVYFPDGRLFHEIPHEDVPEATHLCGQDTYDVAYDFRAFPRWTARWRAVGPRKDYVSESLYSPCDECGHAAETGNFLSRQNGDTG